MRRWPTAGLGKKELVLQSLKKNQEHLANNGADPQVTEEVSGCMESANGLFGFNINGLIEGLQSHGLQWMDLSEADHALILTRYEEHATYWNHSSIHIKEDLSRLAACLGIDVKVLLRKYYGLGRTTEMSGEDIATSSNKANESDQS